VDRRIQCRIAARNEIRQCEVLATQLAAFDQVGFDLPKRNALFVPP
jgi:hypothetical protein